MARFTHPTIQNVGSSANGTWQINGGTTGDQPTFDGAPLFSGNYTVIGKPLYICH